MYIQFLTFTDAQLRAMGSNTNLSKTDIPVAIPRVRSYLSAMFLFRKLCAKKNQIFSHVHDETLSYLLIISNEMTKADFKCIVQVRQKCLDIFPITSCIEHARVQCIEHIIVACKHSEEHE